MARLIDFRQGRDAQHPQSAARVTDSTRRFVVEVFAGEFPDDAGLAVFAVEVGAAACNALLAHVHVELLAAKPLFKLGMFWTSHRF